jgi:hypothetical protein
MFHKKLIKLITLLFILHSTNANSMRPAVRRLASAISPLRTLAMPALRPVTFSLPPKSATFLRPLSTRSSAFNRSLLPINSWKSEHSSSGFNSRFNRTKLALAAATGSALALCTLYNKEKAYAEAEKTSPEERLRINQLLDQHADEIIHKMPYSGGVMEFSWLPGYLIKKENSRIKGAQAFSDCIQKYGLQYVTVSEKWSHEISLNVKHKRSVKKIELNLAVVKKSEGDHKGTLNLAQARDLCCILRNTKCFSGYYYDAHRNNLLYDTVGRVVLVDTEKRSFLSSTALTGLENLLMLTDDDEVKMFIKQQIDEVEDEWKIKI